MKLVFMLFYLGVVLSIIQETFLSKALSQTFTKLEPIRAVYKSLILGILTRKKEESDAPVGYDNPSSKRVNTHQEKILRDQISPPASLEELQSYGLILASNTCSDKKELETWSCPVHCEGLTKGAKAHHIHFGEGDDFRFNIVSLNDRKMIALGIRGSGKPKKIAETFAGMHPHNIKNATLPWHTLRSDIRVHLPLYESSKKITREAEPILAGLLKQEKYKGYKLVVLGHSLGGALAPLAAMDLKDILKLRKSEIELHVFDTPRVGNIVFANIVNYHFNKLTRVTHGYDPIPRSLLKMAHYCHFANELYYPPIDYFDPDSKNPNLPEDRHDFAQSKVSKVFLDSISYSEDNTLPLSKPRRGKENQDFTSTPVYCQSNPPYDLEDLRCLSGVRGNFNFTSHTFAPTVTYEDTCGGPLSDISATFNQLISEIVKFDIPFLFRDEIKEELLTPLSPNAYK